MTAPGGDWSERPGGGGITPRPTPPRTHQRARPTSSRRDPKPVGGASRKPAPLKVTERPFTPSPRSEPTGSWGQGHRHRQPRELTWRSALHTANQGLHVNKLCLGSRGPLALQKNYHGRDERASGERPCTGLTKAKTARGTWEGGRVQSSGLASGVEIDGPHAGCVGRHEIASIAS